MDEEINYKTLRKIQETEKNSPVLSQIKPDFYNTFLNFLKNLSDRFGSTLKEPKTNPGDSSNKTGHDHERDSGNGLRQTCEVQNKRV